MAMTLPDCRVGTIVDWTTEWTEDGRERPRNPIKRGIITEIAGDNSNEGSIQKILVTFKPGEKAVEVQGRELSRFLPATHRYAKEAFRRIMGQPKHVGAEFAPKAPTRRKVEDALAITPRKNEFAVKPSTEEAAAEAMGFVDAEDTQ